MNKTYIYIPINKINRLKDKYKNELEENSKELNEIYRQFENDEIDWSDDVDDLEGQVKVYKQIVKDLEGLVK